jgi:glycosyltransferase involved in cell wall biosynthesis
MLLNPSEDSRLSIGLMAPGWPPDAFPNGIVTYVATLSPALNNGGHRVAVLAGEVVGEPGDGRVHDFAQAWLARSFGERVLDGFAHRISPEPARLWRLRRALVKSVRQLISDEALDIFEMEESFGMSASIGRAVSIPVCVRLHGPWFLNGPVRGVPDDRVFRRRIRAEGRGLAMAAGVTAPSRDVLDRVRAYHRLSLPDAEVIPPPVAPVNAALRWKMEKCDASRVLFVGRFDRHKGGDLVIESFREISKRAPRARLVFVGPDRGFVADDRRTWRLAEFLQARLPGALESGQVEWLGQQPAGAVANLRRGAAVTVVASRYETFCYAAAEAMALGCPVVASRVGAIPEVIQDRANGLLCRPEDPADLAAKVIDLLENPTWAAELGAQAAIDCERLYHPDVIAARVVAFYRRVLGRGRAR